MNDESFYVKARAHPSATYRHCVQNPGRPWGTTCLIEAYVIGHFVLPHVGKTGRLQSFLLIAFSIETIARALHGHCCPCAMSSSFVQGSVYEATQAL